MNKLKIKLSSLVIERQQKEMESYSEISCWSKLPLKTLEGLSKAFKENNEADKWIINYLKGGATYGR